MRKYLYFFLVLCLTIFPLRQVSAKTAFLASPDEVISLINQYRQQNGIAPLAYNALLANLAQTQSNYQASISYVTHTGPDGSTPQERAAAAGYGDGSWFYLSEIIYGGMSATPSSALTWWQNSSLHNSIILDSKYTEIGAGVATDGVSVYFTAELGGTTGGSSGVVPTAPEPGPGELPIPTDPASVIIPVLKSTPMPDGSIHHIVQQGQTLWTIAAIYDTDPTALMDLNELDSSFIFPGDDLLIRIGLDESEVASTPSPTTVDGPKITPTQQPQITPKLGTPFSMVIKSSTTSTPAPQPIQESGNDNLFKNNRTISVLLISLTVMLGLVMLLEYFLQKKPERPTRDDLVK